MSDNTQNTIHDINPMLFSALLPELQDRILWEQINSNNLSSFAKTREVNTILKNSIDDTSRRLLNMLFPDAKNTRPDDYTNNPIKLLHQKWLEFNNFTKIINGISFASAANVFFFAHEAPVNAEKNEALQNILISLYYTFSPLRKPEQYKHSNKNIIMGQALCFATELGQHAVIEHLLKNVPEISIVDKRKALNLAAEKGKLDIFTLLLEALGNNITTEDKIEACTTAYDCFSSCNIIIKILEHDAATDNTLSIEDKWEWAVKAGHLPMIIDILEHHPLLITAENKGATLITATIERHLPVVQYLLQTVGNDISAKHILEALNLVSDSKDDDNDNAIGIALVHHTASPTTLDKMAAHTILNWAALYGLLSIVHNILNNEIISLHEKIEALEWGAIYDTGTPEVINYISNSIPAEDKGEALCFAAVNKHYAVTEHLLKTAIHQISVVDLKKAIDIFSQHKISCFNEHYITTSITMLKERLICSAANSGDNVLLVKELLMLTPDPIAPGDHSQALLIAVATNQYNAVKILLEISGNSISADTIGVALQNAAIYNNNAMILLLLESAGQHIAIEHKQIDAEIIEKLQENIDAQSELTEAMALSLSFTPNYLKHPHEATTIENSSDNKKIKLNPK